MNDLELRAWTSFVDVVENFLDNHQAENYKELLKKLLKSLQDKGANVSIRVHFVHNHLDEFPDNCSDVKDTNSIKISKQWKSATIDGGTNE